MIVQFDTVKRLLYEEDAGEISQDNIEALAGEKIKEKIKISSTKDSTSKSNKILKIEGIILQDTYNNFLFPIQPSPRLDTSRADINEIYQRYRERYSSFDIEYLPWHYLVELIEDRYYIFNTRPLDLKFPVSNFEVIEYKNNKFETDIIKDFFERRIYQIENMIHICIVGDSNLDIYPSKVYKKIGQICLAPLMRNNHLLGAVEARTLDFNLGRKFNIRTLTRFTRK